MDVGMTINKLSPGVHNAEKSNLCSEMFRIGRYLQESGSGGLEHKVEKDLLVLPHQGDQLVRNTKCQMIVMDRQKLPLPFL